MLGKRVPARVNEGFCDRPGHRRRSPCPSSPSSTPIELRARTASFKWQVSPLLLYSLPWHRARTEPSRKVSCQSASCRATLFGGSREKCLHLEAVPLTERSTSLDWKPTQKRESNSKISRMALN